MSLKLRHLDGITRRHMIAEHDADQQDGKLVLHPDLTDHGADYWPSLLGEALSAHDEVWLADKIRQLQMLGKDPASAELAENLATHQFGHFYARAICIRAVHDGLEHVDLFPLNAEAKISVSPVPVIKGVSPSALLAILRSETTSEVSSVLESLMCTGFIVEFPAESSS